MEYFVINPDSDAYRTIKAISDANTGGGRVSLGQENEINAALGTFACNHWSGKDQVYPFCQFFCPEILTDTRDGRTMYAGFPIGRMYKPIEGVTKQAAEDDDLDVAVGW
jgi:hypothetical protein